MPVASVKEREPGCRHRRIGNVVCTAMLRRTEAGRHWRPNPPVTAEERRLCRRGWRTDAHPAVLCVEAEAGWCCGAGFSGDAAPACSRRVAGRASVKRLRPQASVRRGRSVSGTCCLRTGRRVLADADGSGAGDGEVRRTISHAGAPASAEVTRVTGLSAGAKLALGRSMPSGRGRSSAPVRGWAQGVRDSHFPLPVRQTGSGIQTDMNAKEVLAHAADMAAGQGPGTRVPVHPNDRVNRSPSSNGRLPTVMQMGAVDEARGWRPRPRSGRAFGGIPRLGRIHPDERAPVSLSQRVAAAEAGCWRYFGGADPLRWDRGTCWWERSVRRGARR